MSLATFLSSYDVHNTYCEESSDNVTVESGRGRVVAKGKVETNYPEAL
jgi:hypothetical protein